ncbi:MAG: hypothetical protein HYR83_07800 [Planctomycetes bacterium]|nr:hypothetical protein [Planctomycetota bacterium]
MRYSIWFVMAAAIVVTSTNSAVPISLAEDNAHAKTADCTPENTVDFIRTSLTRSRAGQSRTPTLEALACLAATEKDGNIAYEALRALVHIASEPEIARRYLLQVLDDPRADSHYVRQTICELVIYVADEQVRSRFRQQVAAGWERQDIGPELWSLVELGDLKFLEWLTEIDRNLPQSDQRKVWLQAQERQVKAQHDSDELLTLLKVESPIISNAWLLRQGLRNGVDRDRLRDAAVSFLRWVQLTKKSRYNAAELLNECRESNLLLPEQMTEFQALGGKRPSDMEGPEDVVPWATAADEMRRKFYRLDKPTEQSKD